MQTQSHVFPPALTAAKTMETVAARSVWAAMRVFRSTALRSRLFHKTRTTKKRMHMNHKFDELTKSMAQSVTRRGAFKKFGTGLAGMMLACFGLANKAQAGKCAKYEEPCS